MRALLAVAALAAVGAGAWFLHRRSTAAGAPADAPVDDWSLSLYPDLSDPGVFGGALLAVEDLVTDWKKRAAPYASVILAAAARHGVPGDILLRVGYQESRYREDIITGRTRSSAGAQGMFQFMPATARDLGIDPLNWQQAADGAARYLAQLYRRYNAWEPALMAYNWGMGNVDKYLRGQRSPPQETRNYVAQIGADVSLA